MCDQDLSVAMLTRTDADGRNPDGIGDLFRDLGNDNLQHNGECAGLFHCMCIG